MTDKDKLDKLLERAVAASEEYDFLLSIKNINSSSLNCKIVEAELEMESCFNVYHSYESWYYNNRPLVITSKMDQCKDVDRVLLDGKVVNDWFRVDALLGTVEYSCDDPAGIDLVMVGRGKVEIIWK